MSECTVANVTPNTLETRNHEETTHESERFFAPSVDIHEAEDGLVVVADLPGLEKDNIQISVEKDVLTIKATQKAEPARTYVHREFEPTNYFRQFRLGSKINQANIGADYKHGVLTLTLPYAEEIKPRVIAVQVA